MELTAGDGCRTPGYTAGQGKRRQGRDDVSIHVADDGGNHTPRCRDDGLRDDTRQSFRPATKLTVDLLEHAREQFTLEPEVRGQEPVVLAEMTLRNLVAAGSLDHSDFLARADILRALGIDALISRFQPYHQLAEYLAASTDQAIGLAVGLPSVQEIAEAIHGYNEAYPSIRTPDVLARIEKGERLVPPAVADIIKAKKLFGWAETSGPAGRLQSRSAGDAE